MPRKEIVSRTEQPRVSKDTEWPRKNGFDYMAAVVLPGEAEVILDVCSGNRKRTTPNGVPLCNSDANTLSLNGGGAKQGNSSGVSKGVSLGF